MRKALATRSDAPLAVVLLRPTHQHLLDDLTPDDTDGVLVDLADRIHGCLQRGDRLARVSDVTFAVLVVGSRAAAVRFARQVVLAADAPVMAGDRRLYMGMTVGIAMATDEPALSAATLTQQATVALTGATSASGGIVVFNPAMMVARRQHWELSEIILQALDTDRAPMMPMRYEPVVELATGRLAGVAARLGLAADRPSGASIGKLIEAAARIGRVERLEKAGLRSAITQFGAWLRRWPGACDRLWLCLSNDTLVQDGFTRWLTRVLREADMPAEMLIVELMDGGTQPDAVRQTVRRLRESGVRIVAHDTLVSAERPDVAGTHFAADYVDIPPRLVATCASNQRARRLLQEIMEFASEQGVATLARQVGDLAAHEELLQAGCALARGRLYGTALSVVEADEILAAVATGTWRTPVRQVARSVRSSRAWRELRAVIGALPIVAFACDRNGTLDLAEGALHGQLDGGSDLLGQSLGELVRTYSIRDVDGPVIDQALGEALAGTPTVSTILLGDRWLQVHLCPGTDDHGRVTGALGVAIDVTVRVQAEQALRRSEQRFRSVFANSPIGMAIVAPDGRVLEVNPTLGAMLGYRPEELAGRTLESVWHSDTATGPGKRQAEPADGASRSPHAERACRHRNGGVVWTRVTMGTLPDDSARGMVIALFENLSHVKQLEVELRQAQKLEAVGMLAAGIAHEINTPIQFVGDNLTFLSDAFSQLTATLNQRDVSHGDAPAESTSRQRQGTDADLPWLLEEIPMAIHQSLGGVARVATIVGAMRNFGHPDPTDPSPIDVDAAIRDTTTVARNEYRYVADLHLDLGGVPCVPGYPSQFHQVMLNLVVNAAHAIDEPERTEHGEIRIRSWADETTVYVSVTDNGCGMDAQTRAHMFDPFFTTKPVGKGTGQGLTIVHNVVVERHHGTITVDSEPGHGTVITVGLSRRGPTGQPIPGEPAEVVSTG